MRRRGCNRYWLAAVACLCSCIRVGFDEEEPPADVVACGNGVVDESELCDVAIAGGPGACPIACANADACQPTTLVGSECQTQCRTVVITAALDDDRCCPAGRSGSEDSDCAFCGDGLVEIAETCDPPESCPGPASCISENSCIQASLHGAAATCDARCSFTQIQVCGSDGCCPDGCDAETDVDCSAECGDGVVNPAAGETCERGSAQMACTDSCDDGDPCTLDLSVGSADNCNLQCLVMPIVNAIGGDGCCLPGSNNRLDSDCTPRCGNAVIERGEECDGGPMCSAGCLRLFHEALVHRYRFTGEAGGRTAVDSVGDADGTIVGTTLDGSGDLVLQGGTSDQYVDLPNGMISALSDATFEAWVTWRNQPPVDHERIFDFGTSGNGEDMQGGQPRRSFMFLTPSLEADAKPHVSFSRQGYPEEIIDGEAGSFPERTLVHVAVVFSDSEDSMSLYMNGELIGSTAATHSLSVLTDNNNWLGHSQFVSDAEFGGVFHEFRIYAAALSAADIARSFAAGPDPDAP